MVQQYKMIQIPPNISIRGAERGMEAAQYMEQLANAQAQAGWEFFRVDTVGVQVQPGCLGGLMGRKTETIDYFVVTFRRETAVPPTAQESG